MEVTKRGAVEMTRMTETEKRRLTRALERRRKSGRGDFGTIDQLASGRLRVRYIGSDEGRYAAPNTFDNLGDADTWLAGVRREMVLGTWRVPHELETERRAALIKGTTVDQMFDAYLAEGDLRQRSRDLYEYQWWRLVSPTLGSSEVASLTPADVAEWKAGLPEAPRQREQVSDLLRAVLNLAIDRELIDRNPASRTRRKVKGKPARVGRREIPRLTREEVAMIAAHMPAERQCALLLAAYTGLRFGELAGLRRSDLSLRRTEDGELIGTTLTVSRAVTRPKGDDGVRRSVEGPTKSDAARRSIAVPTGLLARLDAHLVEYSQPGTEGLLFPTASGGLLTPTALYGEKPGIAKHGAGRAHPTKGRGFYAARVAAGRSDANWHQLRAFAISEAVDAGASPADLLRRFGHTDLRTSGLYQRAAQAADAALAERIEVMLPSELAADSTDRP